MQTPPSTARKAVSRPPRTARRSDKDGTAPLLPKFSLVKRSIKKLTAPPGYRASMIFKLVNDDEPRFACWLVVGRYARTALTASYDHEDREIAIRCDVPNGPMMSLSTLRPHLKTFLDAKFKAFDGPPVITGEDD
jgi:hypothetical protein